MKFLRVGVFTIGVALATLFIVPLIFLCMPLPIRVPYWLGAQWRRVFLALSRGVLGIRYRVVGRENIPATPGVILAKHQSAWETVALQDLFFPTVFAFKRELLYLPLFGWGLAALRMIAVDREGGRTALKQLVAQGCDRIAAGFWVVIFPEGTRVEPGTTRRYMPGGAQLAVKSGAPVVPVAHDAGEFWPRDVLALRPGTVTISIGPPIDPKGLSVGQINARASAWIEAEMRRISPHRYDDAAAA